MLNIIVGSTMLVAIFIVTIGICYDAHCSNYEWIEDLDLADAVARSWQYDDTTREWCFYGRHLNAFYEDDVDDNDNVRVTFFAVENATGGRLGCGTPVAHSDMITLPKKVADSIIEDIEENPQDYYLQSYLDYKGDTVYTLCKYLEKMPFDKNGVHATGSVYLESNGDWVLEYEDDIPEDYTPKYIYFAN